MRNRPDIRYLTLLGLSLTVVIAMQKGDSCEDRVKFKLSDADGHHICFLSVDAMRGAFLAVSSEKSSFIFGYNTQPYTSLSSSIKVLVDIKSFGFTRSVPMGIELTDNLLTKDNIPDFSDVSPTFCLQINRIVNLSFSNIQESFLKASHYLSAFPVRAGPALIL